MRTRSQMLLAASILVFAALLSDCGPGSTGGLPAARTPILETLLNVDFNRVVPQNPSGDYSVGPVARLELRFRAPQPGTMTLSVDGIALPMVTGSAAHPELSASGYYRVTGPITISARDSLAFYKLFVVLPVTKGIMAPSGYQLQVRNVSSNASLTGAQKTSAPLVVKIRPVPVDENRTQIPSDVFFSGPDAKHTTGALIARGVTLAGWLVHTPDRGDEDVHYSIYLDDDFIERNYGPTTGPLPGASLPGRCYTDADCLIHPNRSVSLTDGLQPDAGRFMLPRSGEFVVELNTWHKTRHAMTKPSGWVDDPDPTRATDWVWPFDPRFPIDGTTGGELMEGDYVIVSGALIEDSGHLHWDSAPDGSQNLDDVPEYRAGWCWQRKTPGHSGWLEIHPADAIRRVESPATRKHLSVVSLCDPDDGRPIPIAFTRLSPSKPPPTSKSALQFRELIDPRFTDMSTVSTHTVLVDPCDPTTLKVQVVIARGGYFKAAYLLWWSESDTARPVNPCPPQPPKSPTTPLVTDDNDPVVCRVKPNLPQCKAR
ncbi:MAG: hypothetical protein M3081_05640 [Gemmatimonadota bacterium]|nr:hypothetical protein [Gemmatimonadota bacterium]